MRADPSRRVVVDTNIWISAALSTQGAPARVAEHVLDHYVPTFSPATFSELETRLWRPKFDRYISMELRQRLLHDLSAAAFWVEIPAAVAAQVFCRDQTDDKFIHSALVAQAPWLITGDQDLLDVATTKLQGLQIMTSATAMQRVDFTDHK